MHRSSLLKFEAFLRVVAGDPARNAGRSILDIGSKSYQGHPTYRSAAERHGLAYTGLDMSAGENVDIVCASPVVYREIADDSYDFIVSGQTFEHNPFFWATFAEMARILAPGGHLLVIAPGSGPVHRYPVDCWRFYPDAWAALCAMTGLDLVETLFEPPKFADLVAGGQWRDSAVVARKPSFASQAARAGFHARLAAIIAPFAATPAAFEPREANDGPVFAAYRKLVRAEAGGARRKE